MNIIISSTKGSREQFRYDESFRLFKLEKILPAGVVFPYDFGFIPNSKSVDGDLIDVLVLSEFKSFPGCMVDSRLIGCIITEWEVGGLVMQKGRYLAVTEQSHIFENVISIEDVPNSILMEIESFFANYLAQEGKEFHLTGNLNATQALLHLNQYMDPR